MIVMIPSGGTNLGSILSAFARLGVDLVVTEDFATIRAADKVILPGVGHAATMMERLKRKGLDQFIPTLTQPVLGICLGMQILFESSEEGETDMLGIIPAKVVRIPDRGLAIPHMGWNQLKSRGGSSLASAVESRYCYFVHSYMAEDGPWVQSACDFGVEIPAIVQWKNFYGTQFHPERSGPVGEALLARFLCL
ncbi:MAG: imidazole glycerol phosphate synthase subunit HisH [Proteobacteria bacterium]|nr:MAG: imidazole glycerol phosphate synthase subunit HisH [Pseudomonadota bacterium]